MHDLMKENIYLELYKNEMKFSYVGVFLVSAPN